MSDRIREALQFIPATDRDTWLKMGMAIKSEAGDAGFDLWEAWSLQDESFNAKDARDVWKSIRINGKVTAGTLFHEAKANGWRDDGTHQKPTPEKLAERQRIQQYARAGEEARTALERAEAVKKSAAVWKAASEAKSDHPYLVRKRVSPVATLREIEAGAVAAILGYAPKSSGEPLAGRLLVAPAKVGDGLSTLELIDEAGRKSAVYGGAKAGGYWAAQQLCPTLRDSCGWRCGRSRNAGRHWKRWRPSRTRRLFTRSRRTLRQDTSKLTTASLPLRRREKSKIRKPN